MEFRQRTVAQIREFNRFYTVFHCLLNQSYYGSQYSVTETRFLFEMKRGGQMSASQLTNLLKLDKSYTCRIIRNFEKRGLVTRTPSISDRRALVIKLTPQGERETEALIALTDREIFKRIQTLDSKSCDELCNAMQRITEIFLTDGCAKEDNHENG